MSSSDHVVVVRHLAVELETPSSESQSIQLSEIRWDDVAIVPGRLAP
jgi:ribosomal protein L18E